MDLENSLFGHSSETKKSYDEDGVGGGSFVETTKRRKGRKVILEALEKGYHTISTK